MNVACLNVRSLVGDDKYLELEEALNCSKYKIDILGLSEIKRVGDKIIKTKNGNLFCFIGTTPGMRGVGFIVDKKWGDNLLEYRGISDRLALLKIKLDKGKNLTIIQVYAPTATAEEEEITQFYDSLCETLDEQKSSINNQIIVMGDFNSQIGKNEPGEKNIIGPYTYGERNERGWRLVQFCQRYSLKVLNTFFKKRAGLRWTWIAPNMNYKSQIDYILTPSFHNNVTNTEIVSNFRYHSDHRAIMCTLAINKCKFRTLPKPQELKWTPDAIKEYKLLLNNELTNLPIVGEEEEIDIDWLSDTLSSKMDNATKQTKNNLHSNTSSNSLPSTLPKEITNLIEKRESLKRKKKKTTQDRVELNIVCKLIKSLLRKFNRDKNELIIESTLNSSGSLKKLKRNLTIGTQITTHLIDEEGKKQHSRVKINKIATKFYTNLYRDTKTHFEKSNVEINEREPNILEREVEIIVKNLKNNKAKGSDGIVNEQLKYGGEILLKQLTILFNGIIQKQKIPQNWRYSNIILLFKKGNRHKIENYRPISLSSTLSKVFSKIIFSRISNILNFNQPKEQAGFRRGYSTTDHLFTINQLIEKSYEYKIPIHLAFVDYSKAFDSIKHEFMLKSLENQGISEAWRNIIAEMYKNLEARIITDLKGPFFPIEKGVRQGDPLSPPLFSCLLEEIFRKLNWSDKGVSINGEKINNLRFADDITLIASSEKELEQMLEELNRVGREAGLRINPDKTKIMTSGRQIEVLIENQPIENIKETIYLGQTISLENRMSKEIDRRISLGWKKFWQLKDILKGPFSTKQKSKIFNSCIIPVINYGSQTWSLTKKEYEKLKTTQNSMERSMLKIKKQDKIKIQTIKNRMKENLDLVQVAKRRKWEWAGHVARLKDDRWTYKIAHWHNIGRRRRGRQRTRWRDEIEKFIVNKHFEKVALDRTEWQRVKEAFAQNMGLVHNC